MRNGLSSHRKRGGSQSSREQQYRQPNRKGAGIRIKGNFVITTRKGVFRQVRARRTRTFIHLIVEVVQCFRTKGASGVGLFGAIKGISLLASIKRGEFEAIKGPEFREYVGTDPVGFVVSLNLHRRHLNESQRGMVATNIARLSAHRPRVESAPIGAVNSTKIPSQNEAAEMLNVARRTVQRARIVQDEGAPELIEQVIRGNVAVSTASEVAKLPKSEQAEIVAKGEKAILEAAKKIHGYKRGRGGEVPPGTRLSPKLLPMQNLSVVAAQFLKSGSCS